MVVVRHAGSRGHTTEITPKVLGLSAEGIHADKRNTCSTMDGHVFERKRCERHCAAGRRKCTDATAADHVAAAVAVSKPQGNETNNP